MDQTQCPSREELARLISGQTPEPDAEVLEAHVAQCSECLQTTRSLELTDDTLVEALRQAGKEPASPTDEVAERLIPHLRKMVHVAEETTAMASAVSTPHVGAENDVQTLPLSEPDEIADIAARLSPPAAPGEIGRLGGYRLLSVLGKGGMGVVFLAEDLHLERLVALKVIRPAAASQSGAHERFLREARAVAAVKHERIVTIYQVSAENGLPFLAMELLEGETLADRLQRQPPLSIGEVLSIGRQIAAGLVAAHRRGLIHRDIKPANVWLERKDEEQTSTPLSASSSVAPGIHAKLLDFGLARLTAEDVELTASGLIVGTPSYMAPEQAKGETLDARADMFSLGVILYRLATGLLPFQGKDTLSVLSALATHTPAAPQTINDTIPPALSELVMNLLAKERGERIGSAQEVVTAIEAIERQQHCVGSYGNTATDRTPESTPTVALPRNALGSNGRFPPSLSTLVTALGGMALLLAGIILYWQTRGGAVRIEIDDPTITAQIDAAGVTIKQGDDRKIRLTPGTHGLRIKHGELEFETVNFVLTKGQTATLKIELLTGMVRVTDAEGTTLGTAKPRMPKELASHGGRPLSGGTDRPGGTATNVAASSGSLDNGYALAFDGIDDYVELPTLKFDPAEAFTMEVWGDVQNPKQSPQLLHYSGVPGRRAKIQFGVPLGPELPNLMSSVTAGAEQRPVDNPTYASLRFNETFAGGSLHVALVWSPDGNTALFWNGRPCPSPVVPDRTKTWPTGAISMIGAHPKASGERDQFLKGSVRQVRFSKGRRYAGEFTPAERWAPDSDTIALYRFDEGSGDKLVDSSGNGHHGQIVGARWVNSAAPQAGRPVLEFTRGRQYVLVPDFPYDPAKPLTLEARVKLDAKVFGPIVKLQGNSREFVLHRAAPPAGNFGFGMHHPAGTTDVLALVAEKPDFIHVCGVWDGTSTSFFADGQRIGTTSTNKLFATDPNAKGGALLIGGESAISRSLEGRIAEVRISSIVRYQEDFVPAARLQADADTLALYRCDEGQGDQLRDSSGNNRHGKIVGASWGWADVPEQATEAPPGGLEFDGVDDFVELPVIPYDIDGPVTLESWVTPQALDNQREILVSPAGIGIAFSNQGAIFGMRRAERPEWQVLGSPPITAGPMHVCGVFDNKEMRLYVAGRLVASEPMDGKRANPDSRFYLGSLGGRDLFFKGTIHAVRISSAARYREDFTPQIDWQPDRQTLALYRVTEATGSEWRDASGNGYHGKIMGARWVALDARSPGPRRVDDLKLISATPPTGFVVPDRHGWIKLTSPSPEIPALTLIADVWAKDVKISATVARPSVGNASLFVRGNAAIGSYSAALTQSEGYIGMNERSGNKLLKAAPLPPVRDDGTYRMEFSAVGDRLQLRVNDQLLCEVVDTRFRQRGTAGLAAYQSSARFRDVELAVWDPQRPVDPDRLAAEYVISVGGWVSVNDGASPIRSQEQLPQEAFRLTTVEFQGSKFVADDALQCFRGCRHLKHLNLGGTDVSEPGLRNFQACDRLQYLNLYHCKRVTDAAVLQLPELPKLEYLMLSGTPVGDKGIARFSACAGLKTLGLSGMRISNAGLAAFAESRQLKSLDLHDNPQLGDEGLTHFAKCRELTSLALQVTQVSDQGVEAMITPHLVRLEVGATKVTDSLLVNLAQCERLTSLWIDTTTISDAGLSQLHGLKQLTDLLITKTQVTASGVELLHEKLPSCKIKWDGGTIQP